MKTINGINGDILSKKIICSIKRRKDNVAIICENRTLYYSTFLQKIEEFSEILKTQKIERIALYSSNSVELCIMLTSGILVAKNVFIFPTDEYENSVLDVCKDNGVQLLIHNDNYIFFDITESTRISDSARIILYSSGTTGNPKGVMLTAANIYENAMMAIQCLRYSYKDALLIAKPMSHCYGLIVEFIACILAGAHMYLYSGIFEPDRINTILTEEEITVWCTIPSLLAFFLDKVKRSSAKLRIVVMAGERATKELLLKAKERFDDARVLQFYGLSEGGPLVTCLPYDVENAFLGSIGKPVPRTNLVLKDENGCLCSKPGEKGEIVIKSKSVMLGYLGMEEKTENILKGGWLYTGDIAYYDENGYYYHVGRKDSLICKYGVNVYGTEIEDKLSSMNGIEEVCVIGVNNKLCSQSIVAFIKCSSFINEIDVKKYCISHKILTPDKVIFLSSFPRSLNGKISRQELQKIYFHIIERKDRE